MASAVRHRLPVCERKPYPRYRAAARGYPAIGPALDRVAPSFTVRVVGPFLLRVASTGLVLALLTGLWLFSVKPGEYVTNPAFLTKLGLLGFAFCNIALQHYGQRLHTALRDQRIYPTVRVLAALSAILWLSVLVAGRWIGFV